MIYEIKLQIVKHDFAYEVDYSDEENITIFSDNDDSALIGAIDEGVKRLKKDVKKVIIFVLKDEYNVVGVMNLEHNKRR